MSTRRCAAILPPKPTGRCNSHQTLLDTMDNFLISVEHDPLANCYRAQFLNGAWVELGASCYSDAVCEAETIDTNTLVDQ
jgi:hypothetical protein